MSTDRCTDEGNWCPISTKSSFPEKFSLESILRQQKFEKHVICFNRTLQANAGFDRSRHGYPSSILNTGLIWVRFQGFGLRFVYISVFTIHVSIQFQQSLQLHTIVKSAFVTPLVTRRPFPPIQKKNPTCNPTYSLQPLAMRTLQIVACKLWLRSALRPHVSQSLRTLFQASWWIAIALGAWERKNPVFPRGKKLMM